MADKKKKAPEHESSVDTLFKDEFGKVKYGEKEYTIKSLDLGQVLEILRLLGGELSLMKAYADEGANSSEMLGAFMRIINEVKMYKLIAVILGITEDEAKEGFRLKAFMQILASTLKQEDAKEVFFTVKAMVTEMAELIKVEDDKEVRKLIREQLGKKESTQSSKEST